MKKFVFGVLIFSLFGCTNLKSKKHHITTIMYNCGNRNIYLEVFKVFNGGVFGGELKSDYLTDSLNFRFYVGTFDEHQNYLYKCINDTIHIIKIENGNKNCHIKTLKDGTTTVECDVDTLERKKVTITQLVQNKKFE